MDRLVLQQYPRHPVQHIRHELFCGAAANAGRLVVPGRRGGWLATHSITARGRSKRRARTLPLPPWMPHPDSQHRPHPIHQRHQTPRAGSTATERTTIRAPRSARPSPRPARPAASCWPLAIALPLPPAFCARLNTSRFRAAAWRPGCCSAKRAETGPCPSAASASLRPTAPPCRATTRQWW